MKNENLEIFEYFQEDLNINKINFFNLVFELGFISIKYFLKYIFLL